MIRIISLFILIFCSLNIFAQKELANGFIILETKDTISGDLKTKNYFSASRVILYRGDNKIRYPKKVLKEIYIDTINYVKSDFGPWNKAFFIKDISGQVNLYTYKKKKYLGGFDTDVSTGRLIPAINFHCNDYPNLKDSIKAIDNNNVSEFITRYNVWKQKNPESKSFFENSIHNKPLINFKISFFLPGAGFELGLSEKFSINTMLKNEFGYSGADGWIINPFIDTQLRYYHNISKRKSENKRTYKYSGNYFCIVNAYFIENKSNFIGIQYGWQRVINKHFYSNLGLGVAKWTTRNKSMVALLDIDLGYNF